MSKPARVRVSGPLAGQASGFWAELTGRGYTPWSATGQLRLLAHLSRWMAGEGLEPAELTDLQVGRFLRVRRDAGYSQLVSPRGVAPLVGYLRAQGAVPEPAPAIVDGPVEQLLAGFAGYLVRERGVSASTAGYYRRVAGVFLSGRGPGRLGVADLTAKDVTDFLLAEVRRSGGSVGHVAGALRSLLRFLHLQGQIPWPLAAAVPTGPGWHRPSSPRALPAGWVSRLLAGCDRRTTVGRSTQTW